MTNEFSTKESWLLTTQDGTFRFWCAMFHTKHHDFKDIRAGYYRKHRCKKCKIVYLAPNSGFLNQL